MKGASWKICSKKEAGIAEEKVDENTETDRKIDCGADVVWRRGRRKSERGNSRLKLRWFEMA